MNYHLGITNKTKRLNLNPPEESYWCVMNKKDTQVGDTLFLYKTKYGVCQIFKIISEPYYSDEIECLIRDMATIKIRLIENLNNPITKNEFALNKILVNSKPYQRNFQSTLFNLTTEQGNELLKLITEKNPNAEINIDKN